MLFRKEDYDRPIRFGLSASAPFRSDKVPCGKCVNCRKRRAQEWIFRLKEEQKVSDHAHFLTVTYRDEELDFDENGNMTLNSKDHQLFMKRLRTYIKRNYNREGYKVKFYMTAEYGGKYHRPHYHYIIFNVPQLVMNHAINAIWQKGHVDVGTVTGKSINYVCHYLQKQNNPVGVHSLDKRRKEFSIMSQKLGMSYLTKERIHYYRTREIPYLVLPSGHKQAMPRYFKNKIWPLEETFNFDDGTPLVDDEGKPIKFPNYENMAAVKRMNIATDEYIKQRDQEEIPGQWLAYVENVLYLDKIEKQQKIRDYVT